MVGTSRGSSGRGARVYGPVQRVQRRPLRPAVAAGRTARRRAESRTSHRERCADAGERRPAAGRARPGGGGPILAGGGGPGPAAPAGGACPGGVGGHEPAGVARGAAIVGGTAAVAWGVASGRGLDLRRGDGHGEGNSGYPSGRPWVGPPAHPRMYFLDSGGTSPTPLARGVSPLDSPFTRATRGGVALAGGVGLQWGVSWGHGPQSGRAALAQASPRGRGAAAP